MYKRQALAFVPPDPVEKLHLTDKTTEALCVVPMQRGVQPVSYTHLRAHETPEHLVCRLLLEKKKPRLPPTYTPNQTLRTVTQ